MTLSLKLLMVGLLIFNCKTSALEESDYRLDHIFKPQHYAIQLTLNNNFATEKVFEGTTSITVLKTLNSNPDAKIRLHKAKELKLTRVDIDGIPVSLNQIDYSNETEIMGIPLVIIVPTNGQFILTFVYEAALYEDMNGFYLSHVDQSNVIIAATQLQPTFARRAFPCFDEPSFKATFDVSITVPDGYTALSNQPVKGTKSLGDLTQTIFDSTPKMSSYLVAFVVVSEFTSKNVDFNLLPMHIWAPSNVINSTEEAAKVSYKILENLSNQLNIAFESSSSSNIAFDKMGLKQLDQVAVPDFAAGAMENWGLVTYKLSKLLWDPSESTLLAKEILLRIIAHEFTHSWFGNWVTTKTWDTTWLNEGFANYFEYHGLNGVYTAKGFELDKQFIINEMVPIMEADAGNSGMSLTSKALTNDEIKAKFGSITYSKGGSIVRMLKFMTGDNFMKSLSKYINTYKGEAVEPAQLFEVFGKVKGLAVKDIMRNWVEKPGYPVVNVVVTTSADQNNYTLTQKQFFYQKEDVPDTQWYIPIWYEVLPLKATPNPVFYGFLKPNSNVSWSLPSNQTIVINPHRMGYYRVNYQESTWKTFIDVLKTDHNSFDNITKVQLIDDALNLARAGLLSYKTAFDLLDYLQFEDQFYPWKGAMVSLGYLRKRFVGTDIGDDLQKRIGGLMDQLWSTYKGFYVDNSLSPIQVYAKSLTLQWSCLFGKTACVRDAEDLFAGMTRVGPINPDMRSIVYCTTLRNSEENVTDKTNWDILWNKYKESTVANERETILTSLGCTKNKILLKNYLKTSIDPTVIRKQDGIIIFKAVLEANPEFIDEVINFLNTSFKNIPQTYRTKALGIIGDYITTEKVLTQFKEFTQKYQQQLGGDLKLAESAIATAELNQDWINTNKGSLQESLKGFGVSIHGNSYGFGIIISIMVINFNFIN